MLLQHNELIGLFSVSCYQPLQSTNELIRYVHTSISALQWLEHHDHSWKTWVRFCSWSQTKRKVVFIASLL